MILSIEAKLGFQHENGCVSQSCSADENRSPRLELHLRQFSNFNARSREASLAMSRWSHVFFDCFA